MEFKLYVTKSKAGINADLNVFPSMGESAINVETNMEVEEVLSDFKEDFGLEIIAKPPECVSLIEGSDFCKFLSTTKYVVKVFFIVTERKISNLSKFFENACDVWKDEDGRFGESLLRLLERTFVSSLTNASHNKIECLDFNDFLIKNKKSEALRAVCDAGFDPDIEMFIKRADHQSIEFILQHTNLSEEFLSSKSYFHLATFCNMCFPEAYPKLKQIVLTVCRLYPGARLKTALCTKQQGGMNAVEHACMMQAHQMLELFWNMEHAFKTSMNENMWDYDVTNMIPDTTWRQEEGTHVTGFELEDPLVVKVINNNNSDVSYLERIIASSVKGDKRAAKMIGLEPIRLLIHDYVIWDRLLRSSLFVIQFVFMVVFTWHTLNHANPKFAALESCYISNNNNSTTTPNNNNNSTTTPNFNHSATCIEAKKHLPSIVSGVLLMVWPLLGFMFAMLQLVGLCKLIKGCGVGVDLKTIILSFPFYDLTLLICFVLRICCLSDGYFSQNYFELVATIFILGWIRPILYLSYTNILSAFTIALKSSMVKYIVSFIFMFTFVYIGFSLSFKSLLTKHTHAELDKPMSIIAYVSFVTLFGMGELDQVPDDMEEKVDTVLFLKFVICMYCSCTAILILAMIRQPDEELVARVGSELKSRINLKFLKDISWLLVLRKKFNCVYLKEDMYGSAIYELKTFFNFEPRSYRKLKDRYSLLVSKDVPVDEDEVVREDQVNENIENLQLQLASVHRVLGEIKTRMELAN